MKEESIPYEKQIFVCTNEGGAVCGANQAGEKIFKELRQTAKDRGLHPRIRVAQAKCLGQCGKGVNMMVYPDQIWHSGVTEDDIGDLINKYLKD